ARSVLPLLEELDALLDRPVHSRLLLRRQSGDLDRQRLRTLHRRIIEGTRKAFLPAGGRRLLAGPVALGGRVVAVCGLAVVRISRLLRGRIFLIALGPPPAVLSVVGGAGVLGIVRLAAGREGDGKADAADKEEGGHRYHR